MRIVTRAEWGARPWRPTTTMYTVSPTEKTEWLAHYHGNPPRHDRGHAMAKEVEAIHYANGWAGIGYNHLVGQDGVAYEGRGWGLVGAHCPGHNRSGYGVYFAVGGAQRPTSAAETTARALYDEACTRAGRRLKKTWHGANWPTECPGPFLRAWVRGGMPVPAGPPPMNGDDDMAVTADDLVKIAEAVWAAEGGRGDDRMSQATRLARAASGVNSLLARPVVDVEKLAAAIVAGLPTQAEVTVSALADEIARRLEA